MSNFPVSSIHIFKQPVAVTRESMSLPLHGKCLLLYGPDGAENRVTMVVEGNPSGATSDDNVALCILHSVLEKGESEPDQQGLSPAAPKCSGSSAYLDEEAVKAIREAPYYGDFILQLSE
jgi:hypothetical protein